MREDLRPPGATEILRARSTLVVAPHYDDEVLGCGGLLRQLTIAGGAVRVLFLTDGAGGEEEVDDRDAYRARRRREARAATEALGVVGYEELGLPDGELHHHLTAMATAVRRSLQSARPSLLLVPSPLEVTTDHRAAFAAVFDLLSGIRSGDDLRAVGEGLTVLLYDVNHAAYPDLLVDVSGEVGAIEVAMRCYQSQLARHDYLGGSLGLRRFRALSLPPDVTSVEGYRRLRLDDFTTRSRSRLIHDLGGSPERLEVSDGPLVSMIVRTHNRPDLLAEAVASVAASTYRRVELVLVNDGGESPEVAADFPFPVRMIELTSRRGRAGAANAGVAAATGEYVAFLDDDDLVEPEHLTTLVALVGAAEVQVAYTDAAVGVYELDGEDGWRQVERRLPYSRDFDPGLLLLDNYIPFNTLLVARSLYEEAGPFDEELPFFEDWEMLVRLATLRPFHHLARVTCEYRHFRGGSHILGERPREQPDFLAMKERVVAKHRDRLGPGVLARVVDGLRRETVETAEVADTAAKRLAELERVFHRQGRELEAARGESEALRNERESLRVDIQRLYDAERELRAAVDDQTDHLGRTYAEIERLGSLVETMRSTRAWRLHEWIEKRRG